MSRCAKLESWVTHCRIACRQANSSLLLTKAVDQCVVGGSLGLACVGTLFCFHLWLLWTQLTTLDLIRLLRCLLLRPPLRMAGAAALHSGPLGTRAAQSRACFVRPHQSCTARRSVPPCRRGFHLRLRTFPCVALDPRRTHLRCGAARSPGAAVAAFAADWRGRVRLPRAKLMLWHDRHGSRRAGWRFLVPGAL